MNYTEYKKLNNASKDIIKISLIAFKCKDRESLWNVKLKDYCNRNKRFEFYREISIIAGIYGYYLFIYILS